MHNEIPKYIVHEKKIIIATVKFRENYMVVKKSQDPASLMLPFFIDYLLFSFLKKLSPGCLLIINTKKSVQ